MPQCRELEIFAAQQKTIDQDRDDLGGAGQHDIEGQQYQIGDDHRTHKANPGAEIGEKRRAGRFGIGRVKAHLNGLRDAIEKQRTEQCRNRSAQE